MFSLDSEPAAAPVAELICCSRLERAAAAGSVSTQDGWYAAVICRIQARF